MTEMLNLETQEDQHHYQVLARKYRPQEFSSLIGQEALVQTLSNAISSRRLAHAFLLTGVRGVGKTTAARIIARSLNCSGPTGEGGPTVEPCGECDSCSAISSDRHVDVIEMDAASRTGVDDVRELIDGVLYRPVSGRFKIYIIDEVHMLSRNAFNALLKTLEEPPEHVKFIFATTEVRRVPVTVLSRCQRFDLRRVNIDVLKKHFAKIAENEGATIAEPAIDLISKAADGSVRDGLSILDQAIAHSGLKKEIKEDAVRKMLGATSEIQIFDLFEKLMKGEIAAALRKFDEIYQAGSDPIIVLQDLAGLIHWLTRFKMVPESMEANALGSVDSSRSVEMTRILPISVLSRTWQMLIKGIEEVRIASSAAQAAEMVIIRIAFSMGLPTLEDALAEIDGNKSNPSSNASESASSSSLISTYHESSPETDGQMAPLNISNEKKTAQVKSITKAQLKSEQIRKSDNLLPTTFDELVKLFALNSEPLLHAYLVNNVRPVEYKVGEVTIRILEGPPKEFTKQVSQCLKKWTNSDWVIKSSREEGLPTIQEQLDAEEKARHEEVANHRLVRKALEVFPGSKVNEIYPPINTKQ